MSIKSAIVTGAAKGLGRAISRHLAQAGFSIALADIDKGGLEETQALCLPAETLPVVTDVSRSEDVRILFEAVSARWGRLDLLVNNAGIFGPIDVELEDYPEDAWRRVIDINLTGYFLCTRAAFRLMKDQRPQGGRIINNGSISAHAPRPLSIAYTATKHAVAGLTKSTSLDGRKYSITCGQIDIGNAETETSIRVKDGMRQADGSLKVEPTMAAENVAKAVAMMASLPPEANVQSLIVLASQMPFLGRG